MTQIQEIMINSFRELGLINENNFPTYTQARHAIKVYNRLLSSLIGGQAGQRLENWKLGSYAEARPVNALCPSQLKENSRLVATNTQPLDVYFPSRPCDGAQMALTDPYRLLGRFPVTLHSNGCPIEGQEKLVFNTPGLSAHWFFRKDLSQWMRLVPLAAEDIQPFPEAYDSMFQVLLASRLSPVYGKEMPASSASTIGQNMADFVARYIQRNNLEVSPELEKMVDPHLVDERAFIQGGNTW